MTEKIKNELLDYGLDDMFYVGWAIQVTSRHLGTSPTDPAIVEPMLKVITQMLEAGHIVAGPIDKDPADGLLYVRSWDLSPEETVHKIREGLNVLDDLPTPGQVAWFELTDAGRAEATRLRS